MPECRSDRLTHQLKKSHTIHTVLHSSFCLECCSGTFWLKKKHQQGSTTQSALHHQYDGREITVDIIRRLRLTSACPVTANVFDAKDACTLGLLKCITSPSSLIMFTWTTQGQENESKVLEEVFKKPKRAITVLKIEEIFQVISINEKR